MRSDKARVQEAIRRRMLLGEIPDQKLLMEDVFIRLSEKHNVDVEHISDIYDTIWRCVKMWTSDPELPTVRFPNWGKFAPSLWSLCTFVVKLRYRVKDGEMFEAAFDSMTQRWWLVLNRLANESRKKRELELVNLIKQFDNARDFANHWIETYGKKERW